MNRFVIVTAAGVLLAVGGRPAVAQNTSPRASSRHSGGESHKALQRSGSAPPARPQLTRTVGYRNVRDAQLATATKRPAAAGLQPERASKRRRTASPRPLAPLQQDTGHLNKKVQNFYDDCCNYNGQIQRRYRRVAINPYTPESLANPRPKSELGRKMEEYRRSSRNPTYGVERNRLRLYGTPIHDALAQKRTALASETKASRKQYGTPANKGDYARLTQQLGPLGAMAKKLDTAHVKLTTRLAPGGLRRDLLRDLHKTARNPARLFGCGEER